MTCSGEEKVTAAILKVDLQCCQCYRKIKKTLCRFPQIRDQVYDEKQNTVSITIVCCSPERIIDKLCSKAGKTIKSVHIKKPDSDQPKPKPKPIPAAAPPPASDPEKPKSKPKPSPAPDAQPPAPSSDDKPPKKQKESAPAPKPAADPPKPAAEPPKAAAAAEAPKAPAEPPKAAPPPATQPMQPAQLTEPVAQWVPGYPPGPPPQVCPVSMYCTPSYDAGYYPPSYGRPPCPHPYYSNRCDYFTEENPSACSIM